MKEKKRAGSTDLSDRTPLTKSGQRKGYRHPNRNLSKSKQKKQLIEMNPHFTFYFDERGVCCYRKKAARQ